MVRFLYNITSIYFLLIVFNLKAQTPKVHSHNDYEQKVPFWGALSAGATSIEADVFLVDGELFVAHEKQNISKERTLESLYLAPLSTAYKLSLLPSEPLQILIDLKTEAVPTLEALITSIKKYSELVDNPKIRFVISGNRPPLSDYTKYPAFILFDYQENGDLSPEQLNKIALVSYSIKPFTKWNGKGAPVQEDVLKIREIVRKSKKYGKPLRFWGTPDSKSSWELFVREGIDYINTDKPALCHDYIKSLPDRTFSNALFTQVYKPTFFSDRSRTPVRQVILMIGDGNGLAQISSSVLANHGTLSLTQLKSIGFIKTASFDNFSTDSAAGATAMSTGKKTRNRYIGVDADGRSLPTIAEILSDKGFSTGVITTDEITGATPSAFYAHQKERDFQKEIAKDFLKSKLNFAAGGGKNVFISLGDYKAINDTKKIATSKDDQLVYFLADGSVPPVLKGRGNAFPETVQAGLEFLSNKNKPFFLMVEGAQIDSGGHANNTATIITEGVDFDRAISQVLKYADSNPGTLVIITADHETGGFSMPHGDLATNTIEGAFVTDDHSGILVPVFAYGPYSDLFTGVYENTEIFHKILQALNIN